MSYIRQTVQVSVYDEPKKFICAGRRYHYLVYTSKSFLGRYPRVYIMDPKENVVAEVNHEMNEIISLKVPAYPFPQYDGLKLYSAEFEYSEESVKVVWSTPPKRQKKR